MAGRTEVWARVTSGQRYKEDPAEPTGRGTTLSPSEDIDKLLLYTDALVFMYGYKFVVKKDYNGLFSVNKACFNVVKSASGWGLDISA